MTIPVERTNAILYTSEFLKDLMDPKKTPRIPKHIRLRARQLLKHYPTQFEMEIISEREDEISNSHPLHFKIFSRRFI